MLSQGTVLNAFERPAKVSEVAAMLGTTVKRIGWHALRLQEEGRLIPVGVMPSGIRGGRPARLLKRISP